MAETLSVTEMIPNKFEPKRKNRWVFAIEGIDAFLIKTASRPTFSTTENLIKNFENKAFVALQRYMVLITASRILRKFLFLSEAEQSKLIDATISKLGGFKKWV